jgi:pimeloyl-ACP methyl ester carboxylesterase
MALQAPSAVTHVVFVGIPLIGRRARAQLLESWAPPMELASDGSHFDTIWQRYASQRSMPPDFLTLLDASLFTVHERYNWAYNAAFRYDPAADLPRLRVPVLFVNSEADVLIAADRRAVEMVPDGRLIAVPGETHPLPWQVPERFAEAVIDFVIPS